MMLSIILGFLKEEIRTKLNISLDKFIVKILCVIISKINIFIMR